MRTTSPVVGISDHCGWAELVTVGVEGGVPTIRDRRRVQLVAAGLPTAPYHHEALEQPLEEAEPLVARVQRSVAEHCRRVLAELKSAHRAGAVTLQRSPYERLPEPLASVLASRALTCAADGMMYREALADAAAELGMEVDRYPRKSDPAAAAADALGVKRAAIVALIARLGSELGPPWRKEHKDAAASALRVLAHRSGLRL